MSAISAASAEPAGSSPVRVHRLRCEYLVNPLGIDRPRPRLSWNLASPRRGELQTAWQILAASSEQALARDQGDLWDSGRVDTPDCVHVVYAGRPLVSGQRVWWKVRVWDRDGQASSWSEPAWWEMGLLDPADWKGRWLAGQPDREQLARPFTPEKMQWVWYPEEDQAHPPKDVPRYFRRVFEIPSGSRITRAAILITVDDHYVLYCNGREIGSHGLWEFLQIYDLTTDIRPGRNVLAIAARNLGDAAGVICQLRIDFEGGEPMHLYSDAAWRCSDEEAAGWREANFNDAGWPAVRVVGHFHGPPWGELYLMPETRPAPCFRRVFDVNKPVRSARAYICGLGYHELTINGQRIGDHRLDPAYTNYDKRAVYVTHDITDHLVVGRNAVGVVLGTGWYNMHAREVWDFDKAPWRDVPCLKMQLEIEYQDASRETVVTDESWKVGSGPIVYDCIRVGEVYDARLEQEGWDTTGFDDSGWGPPVIVRGPRGRLVAQMLDPIRVTATRPPVRITEPRPGVFVVDAGQNLSGWTQISVRGPRGTKIDLIHGEKLNPDGTVNLDNIREFSRQPTFQTSTYILKGEGEEVYEPRFTYYGFQYVEVHGWPGRLTADNIRIRVAHTDCPQIGRFTCSSELFNRLRENAVWSYWSNFFSIPTDCPHREKNGWTGDAHMAARLAMYQFDNAAGYTKWIADMADAMREDGSLPGIVPTGGWGYHWGNGPAWDSAYLLIPWYLYLYCGDTAILFEHYERFRHYVDYLTSRAEGHIVRIGLGDWVPLDQQTPEAVTSTGYYYQDARIVAAIARMMGREDEARRYDQLADEIRKAFNEAFVDRATGRVANGTQCAQACALYQGLVDEEDVPKVLAELVANIERCGGHINSGVLGSIYIPHALTDHGRPDLAWRIAAQTEMPGWGYWVKQGATTLWEDWRGQASLNHIFFGDIVAWFYQTLAGIRIDPGNPGFRHVIIRPHVLGDIDHAEAEVLTVRGKVASAWSNGSGGFTLKVTIPPGSTATVWLPSVDRGAIRESGRPLEEAEAVRFVGIRQNHSLIEIGSGAYTFTAPAVTPLR